MAMMIRRISLFSLILGVVGCSSASNVGMNGSAFEMSDEEQDRWFDSELPRFGDPEDYFPPNTIETMYCDYTKGDMHDIRIFAVKGTLDEIGRWYTTQLPIHIYEKTRFDPGQRTLYSLSDRDFRSYSVILADSENEQAAATFASYVGPKYLDRMIVHRPCIIGALYLEEQGWVERNSGTQAGE